MINKIKATNLMNKKVKTVQGDSELSKVLYLFNKGHKIVVVLDKNSQYSGVVTSRSILRNGLYKGSTKINKIKINAPMITKHTSASECIRLMIENDVFNLPVFEDNKFIGVIEDSLLLDKIRRTSFGKEKVKDYMTKDIVFTEPNEKISNVLNKFKTYKLLPVVEKNSLVGIVRRIDLFKLLKPKKKQRKGHYMNKIKNVYNLPVKNIMKKRTITVKESQTLSSVIKRIVERDIYSIIVLKNNKRRLAGIITKKDILEPLSNVQQELILPLINISSKIRINRKSISRTIKDYAKMNPYLLKQSSFNIYFNSRKETFRKDNLIYIIVRIHTPAGRFSASAEGWTGNYALNNALAQIDKQIEKKLDLQRLGTDKIFNRNTY